MAAFIALTSWQGEFTDDYLARPAPDPAQFGMPSDDDGSRDDPLLSGVSDAVTAYVPDLDALHAAPTRLVLAVGEESAQQLPARSGAALADRLGQQATVFPSHHGGFMGGEHGYAGKPEDVRREAARGARRLRCGQCTTTGGTPSSSSRCVSSCLRGRNSAGITVSSTIAHATQ